MAITPKNQTIEELLGAGTAKLVVPSFQRDFDWGKDEAEELWNDIDTSERGVYLGNIVVDVSKKDIGEFSIVDGQQRLTTLCLLLIACRTRSREIREDDLAADINHKLTYTNATTGRSIGSRLEVSSSIRDVFEYIVASGWDGNFPSRIETQSVKPQMRKVKPIYELFVGKFARLRNLEEISSFLSKLYNSFVIKIEVDSDSDVFDIFERANARGMELNAAELLKAHLFALPEIENIEERWDEIREYAGANLLRTLKYFYVSKRGYITKSNLFPRLKEYAQEVGPENLVNQLGDFAGFYSTLNKGDADELGEYLESIECQLLGKNDNYCGKLYRVIEALRFFRVTQPYPVLYAALKIYEEKYKDNTVATQQLINLFEVIEKYHFVNNVICDRIGNEIEKLYAETAPLFNNGDEFALNSAHLVGELKEKLAKYPEFEPRFREITYSANAIPLISYIFDRFNNFDRNGGQITRIYFPSRGEFRRNFNTDHFLARNLRGELSDPDLVDSIGNLLIISRHTNFEMQDRPPAEKLEVLKKRESFANLPHVKEFVRLYEDEITQNGWNKDQILKRSQDLAKFAYERVWKF